MPELAVCAERTDGAVVLRVSGELDLGSVDLLRDAAAGQLGAVELRELALDLGGVTFLDSSGLGALLEIRGKAIARGAAFRVTAVAPGPGRIIGIAGLSETFGLRQA